MGAWWIGAACLAGAFLVAAPAFCAGYYYGRSVEREIWLNGVREALVMGKQRGAGRDDLALDRTAKEEPTGT